MNEDDYFETKMVQFNKRIPQDIADGYEILAIKTHKKVPRLLAEGLALLYKKYSDKQT